MTDDQETVRRALDWLDGFGKPPSLWAEEAAVIRARLRDLEAERALANESFSAQADLRHKAEARVRELEAALRQTAIALRLGDLIGRRRTFSLGLGTTSASPSSTPWPAGRRSGRGSRRRS